MHIRKIVLSAALAVAGLLCAVSLAAQEPGVSANKAGNEKPNIPPNKGVSAPYGMSTVPSIYLVNFLFLYVADPNIAADMPAYRTPIPQPVYDCLLQNPSGCSYAELEPFFAEDPNVGGGKTDWPSQCQEDPKWERLAPTKARQAEQINEPLGIERADRIARALGIDARMVLTPAEYQCLIGAPETRTPDQQTIYSCVQDLTNSNGNADTPLSSYGIYINDGGNARSVCAPDAPCLKFNALLAGPLEQLARQCGFLHKLARLTTETPLLKFVRDADPCQKSEEPTCIVPATDRGKGAKEANAATPTAKGDSH
jgi:hypothetical protein